MGLIIDTSVLVRVERSGQPIDFTPYASHGAVFISAITVSELLVGVHRADSDARLIRRSTFVEGVIDRIPVRDFNAEIARVHAILFADLSRTGRLIPAHDLIIAATAVCYDSALLTADMRDFQRVPGLRVLML